MIIPKKYSLLLVFKIQFFGQLYVSHSNGSKKHQEVSQYLVTELSVLVMTDDSGAP